MPFEPTPGDAVLVLAQISDNGRTVMIAPGVELPVRSVKMIDAEVPNGEDADEMVGLVLLFPDAESRAAFINEADDAI